MGIKLTDKQVSDMENMVAIQGTDGTWNTSEYMVGMYNGMELMMATVENREPVYKSPQDVRGDKYGEKECQSGESPGR